jgi:hypothetical protein
MELRREPTRNGARRPGSLATAGNVRDAVARARRLDPTGAGHAINPSTGVWRLVDAILVQT